MSVVQFAPHQVVIACAGIAADGQFVFPVQVETIHVDVHELKCAADARLALHVASQSPVLRSHESSVVKQRAAGIARVVAQVKPKHVKQFHRIVRLGIAEQRGLVIRVLPHVFPYQIHLFLVRLCTSREFFQQTVEGVPVASIIDDQPRIHDRYVAGVFDRQGNVVLKGDVAVATGKRPGVLHVQRAAHFDVVFVATGRDQFYVILRRGGEPVESSQGASWIARSHFVFASVGTRIGVVR